MTSSSSIGVRQPINGLSLTMLQLLRHRERPLPIDWLPPVWWAGLCQLSAATQIERLFFAERTGLCAHQRGIHPQQVFGTSDARADASVDARALGGRLVCHYPCARKLHSSKCAHAKLQEQNTPQLLSD